MLGHHLGYENPYVQHRDMLHGDESPWVFIGRGGGPGRLREFLNILRAGVWRGFLHADIRYFKHSGPFAAHYCSGRQMTEGQMLRGREHGAWKYWYEDGQLAAEGVYICGREHGLWRLWHPTGALATELPYTQGKLAKDRVSEVFSDKGKLLHREVPLTDGGTHETWFHADGSKMSEGIGRPAEEGVWTSWYESGQKRLENEYLHGKIHGYYRTWYENGQLESESTWEHDEPHGESAEWYEDGTPKRVERHCEGGGTVGRWQRWWQTGTVELDVDVGDGIQLAADPEPVWGLRERFSALLMRLTGRQQVTTYTVNLGRTWGEWEMLVNEVNNLESAAMNPIKLQLQAGYMERDVLEQAAIRQPQLREFVESLDSIFRSMTSEAPTSIEGGTGQWWWFRRPLNTPHVEDDNTGWDDVRRGASGRLEWRQKR